MITYPLLKWTQRRYARKPITFKDDGVLIIAQILLFGLLAGFQLGLETDSQGRTDLMLVTALALVTFGGFYLLPILIHSDEGYKYSLWLRLIGPVGVILLNLFRDGSNEKAIYGFCAQLSYDLLFMA